LIDDGILTEMTRAGCNNIKIGVETGSESIMEVIDKDISLKQVKSAVKLLNKHNFFWSAYL
jgi:radical SAM superfamily enzyme YgiQ (UPF0313 family)|tara:strand:- start:631 stop:813 length:183 start_codon:yes stop_codon:yes gene_type:complete